LKVSEKSEKILDVDNEGFYLYEKKSNPKYSIFWAV
jgi:hypothetical protein